ncbi:MAG: hypothetical protein HYS08_01770 [Chlamydiae bacterium]|nr:hypothetical protein [Chlamydiota bacterium]
MIFLSLLNFLKDGCIWKKWAQDPIVQKGLSEIADYQTSFASELQALYLKRDLSKDQEKIIPLDLGLSEAIVKPFMDPSHVEATAKKVTGAVSIDGKLEEWKGVEALTYLLSRTLEFGKVVNPQDLDAKAYFQWDSEYLYFAIEVVDDQVMNHEVPQEIYKGDCVELFMDPEDDSFTWGNPKKFQIGFSPTSSFCLPQCWAWFQKRAPRKGEVQYAVMNFLEGDKKGYRVEAAISWKFLGIEPKVNLARISHHISTTTANSASSALSDSVGHAQHTVKYASHGLGRLPRIQGGLGGLATKSDEKCGLIFHRKSSWVDSD